MTTQIPVYDTHAKRPLRVGLTEMDARTKGYRFRIEKSMDIQLAAIDAAGMTINPVVAGRMVIFVKNTGKQARGLTVQPGENSPDSFSAGLTVTINPGHTEMIDWLCQPDGSIRLGFERGFTGEIGAMRLADGDNPAKGRLNALD